MHTQLICMHKNEIISLMFIQQKHKYDVFRYELRLLATIAVVNYGSYLGTSLYEVANWPSDMRAFFLSLSKSPFI